MLLVRGTRSLIYLSSKQQIINISSSSCKVALTTSSTSFISTFNNNQNNNNKYSQLSYYSSTKMSKPGVTEAAVKQDPRDTIFAKIVEGSIPCKKVYEDDDCLAFDDISPQAPVHVLLIPKHPIGGINDATEEHATVLGKLMTKVPKIAKLKDIDHSGYRLVVNEGIHGQQSVRWLHIHILGGRQLNWPPC
ncbi:putative protein kinase C inhibitor [Cavenderia fasciculata]|uniref:HIT domain-containing protein n=1 Tax=Cavenderia fasciculata TaxID=261658 RepID=F4QEQ9_CACFS|nr:putative protein kinase C inhibitor [Cavenderia fasciculata]EGG13320.1 putative protein kinase C inhibitor [Cavenderia fasciculata]|eukprot:XP_004350019.1 putative protein kinase C inhibitor [Cavenderia fasciculata]